MRLNTRKFLVTAAAILAAAASLGGAMTGEEIAAKAAAAAYYKGDDGKAMVTMEITDARGRERSRELIILRRDQGEDNGPQQFYVYFTAPADVDKTAFLVWKKPESDDDRWLYLPALDLVRRIAASDERTSFVGSHFYYEDVSGRSPLEDTHELVETTENYYVLESKPREPESVEFASFKSWIHKETFLPVKIAYTNAKGEEYRSYQAVAVETIDGFPTVTKALMKDMERGGETLLTYHEVQYNLGMDEGIFAERYLRNPPAEVQR